MNKFIELLDDNLEYISHDIIGDTIYINVKSNKEFVVCPFCGNKSSRCHSTYIKTFQDLPIQNKKVIIVLNNRKMFCDNPKCNHTTFGESFDFIGHKSKKTKRLIDYIIDLSCNMSSVAAQNYLRKNGVNVSKSTICNFIKKKNIK